MCDPEPSCNEVWLVTAPKTRASTAPKHRLATARMLHPALLTASECEMPGEVRPLRQIHHSHIGIHGHGQVQTMPVARRRDPVLEGAVLPLAGLAHLQDATDTTSCAYLSVSRPRCASRFIVRVCSTCPSPCLRILSAQVVLPTLSLYIYRSLYILAYFRYISASLSISS